MGPEVFVVASSVILGCVLVFLTVVTQVQVHTATCLAAAWTSARAVLCLRLRARFRRNDGTSGPATSRDRQAPGKRARRTERRRLKRALINEVRINNQAYIHCTCIYMYSSISMHVRASHIHVNWFVVRDSPAVDAVKKVVVEIQSLFVHYT